MKKELKQIIFIVKLKNNNMKYKYSKNYIIDKEEKSNLN